MLPYCLDGLLPICRWTDYDWTMNSTTFLALDGQRRISLGRIAPKGATGFLAERHADGSILLTPATPVPDVEVSADTMELTLQGFAAITHGEGTPFNASDWS